MTYFVAHNKSEKEGYKRCLYCNREFKPNSYNQIYCSRECYLEGVKYTKKVWYQKNRERIIKKQIDYNKEKRREKFINSERKAKPPNYAVRSRTRFHRNLIIMQELLNLELYTFQRNSLYIKQRESVVIDYRKNVRHKIRDDIVQQIKNSLHDLELYDEQIKKAEKYHVDLDDYKQKLDSYGRFPKKK